MDSMQKYKRRNGKTGKAPSKNIIKNSLFFLKISGSFFERICYTVLVHICDKIIIEETQVKS